MTRGSGTLSPRWLAAGGTVLGLAVLVYDVIAGGGDPFDEGIPAFDLVGVVRSVSLIGCAVLLVLAVERAARPGAVTSVERHAPGWSPIVVASLVFSAGTALLFAVSARRYHTLSLEDGPAEWLTAIGFFAAAAAAVAYALRQRAWRSWRRLLVAAGGILLFAMGGEEISWGQRVLGFSTPARLTLVNQQGEANLHNLATNQLEAIFYVGAVVLFVVVPYADHRMRWSQRWPAVAVLVPPLELALVAAPMAAMTYDQWNVMPAQLAVMATLAVLAAMVVSGPVRLRALAAAAFLVTAASQALFLWHGHAFLREWDVTEYRETVIAGSCLVYVWWTSRSRLPAPRPPGA